MESPKHNLENEQAIIWCMLIDSSIIWDIISELDESDFYDFNTNILYKAISYLYGKQHDIDLLTVKDQLTSMPVKMDNPKFKWGSDENPFIRTNELEKIWGLSQLMEYTELVPTTINYPTYIKTIKKYSQLRSIKRVAQLVETNIDNNLSPEDVVKYLEKWLRNVLWKMDSWDNLLKIDDILQDHMSELAEWIEDNSSMKIIWTWFKDLDSKMWPLMPWNLCIIWWRPWAGKCHWEWTKIIMYDWTLKNVEDIIIWDKIMWDDSRPRNIIALVRWKENMYKINQNQAIDYIVNESHILSLRKSRKEWKYNKGYIEDISLNNYLMKSNKWKSNYKWFKLPFDFNKKFYKDQIIDPYLLWLWLWDWSSRKSSIYNWDIEIQEYIRSINNYVINESQYNWCIEFKFSKWDKLISQLKELHLIQNKHIPKEYIITSRKNRLKILAWLLDTDWYKTSNTWFEIVQKSERLIDDIKYICDSLWFLNSKTIKIWRIKSIWFEWKYFKLTISWDTKDIPLLVKRKQITKKSKFWIVWHNTWFKVESLWEWNYYWFTIDWNNRYLLSDWTVTHNSATVMNMINNNVLLWKKIAFFSLEMNNREIVNRFISMHTEVNSFQLKKWTSKPDNVGKKEFLETRQKQYEHISDKLWDLLDTNLYIDDTTNLTPKKIKARLSRITLQDELDLIVIDYLWLMKADTKWLNKTNEVWEITRELKTMAWEFNCPIICLSQLNRSLESRADKRPMMSDLRDSWSIEQDANQVIFLYRPKYYDEESFDDSLHLIIGKNRDWGSWTIQVWFNLKKQKLYDLTKEEKLNLSNLL